MRLMAASVFIIMMFLGTVASAAEPLPGHSLDEAPAVSPQEGSQEFSEYYIEGKQTVEGVVSAVNSESGQITIVTQSGEEPFVFDNDTRFRLGLRPSGLEAVRPGLKVAGLYVDDAGSKRLIRVMVLKELTPIKHKHTRAVKKSSKKKKPHRKKKRR